MLATIDTGAAAVAAAPGAGAISPRDRTVDRAYRLRQSGADILLIFVVLQLGSVIYALLEPDRFPYLTDANISLALQAIPLLGIVALGVGVLMIAGEFDLSVGANFIFSSVMVGQLTERGTPEVVAVLIGLGIGVGIGLLNGYLTLQFRIPSFVTTLGTMGIWSAATLLFHGTASQAYVPSDTLSNLLAGELGIFSAQFLWLLAFAIALWGFLQRHRLGNHVLAAGGNALAAISTGVPAKRAKLLAFAIAGFAASLSGLLAAARVGNISPAGGTDLPLQAIAACVIGGVALAGGRGTVLGIFVGASLIYWIQDVLLLLAAPAYYLTAFVGGLIIAAGILYERVRGRG
ncbi:MAG TPA: ABC transporter permease [Conexibacter sp.]